MTQDTEGKDHKRLAGMHNPWFKLAVSATVIRDFVIFVTVLGGTCDVTEVTI